MINDRTILHCDLNGFYASVEMLSHPELAGLPVAVGGDPSKRKGIILAKNEEAKKFGVATGEPLWTAKRKCPKLVVLPSHHELYEEYSIKVNDVYTGDNALYIDLNLIGPAAGEAVNEVDTYPVIVLKMERREESVVFKM